MALSVPTSMQAVSSFDNWADVITGDTTCSERMEQGLAFPLWDPSLGTPGTHVFRGCRHREISLATSLSQTRHTPTP
jgi:hypothetical protein